MGISSFARKGHKKAPFLSALTRLGTISRAAKRVGISRDAVYDWLLNDGAFRIGFDEARKAYGHRQLEILSDALDFFLVVVRKVLDPSLHPKVVSALNFALIQKRSREVGRFMAIDGTSHQRRRLASLGNPSDQATEGDDAGRHYAIGKNGYRDTLT